VIEFVLFCATKKTPLFLFWLLFARTAKLTFDGRNVHRVQAAREAFVALLPPGEPQAIV
jgi:hypothetical protein